MELITYPSSARLKMTRGEAPFPLTPSWGAREKKFPISCGTDKEINNYPGKKGSLLHLFEIICGTVEL